MHQKRRILSRHFASIQPQRLACSFNASDLGSRINNAARLYFSLESPLSDGVSTVDAEIGACNISSRITEQESDSTHQIFWSSHLTLRNQARPLGGELGVVVEDLLGAVIALACALYYSVFNTAYRAVSMYPGEMQFTRMPAWAHSTASELAR